MTCPRCGADCERDEVDNGVGMEACGPWGCPECHWFEKHIDLDPVEEVVAFPGEGLRFRHGGDGHELLDVGAGDEALGLSADDDHAAQGRAAAQVSGPHAIDDAEVVSDTKLWDRGSPPLWRALSGPNAVGISAQVAAAQGA